MKTKSLALLSGENTSIPAAEARALFLMRDPTTEFESPEPRVIIARTQADPGAVGSRIAFSRRVGWLVFDPSEISETVRGKSIRVRTFSIIDNAHVPDPGSLLKGLDVTVDLDDPEYELTVVQGQQTYLALTRPLLMRQGWSFRRPRRRPFFHPSAIFPKLSRALVNLSRCKEGGLFMDPFSGTGSLAIEASEVGATVVSCDLSDSMVRGSLRNMKFFHQSWLGQVRCDSRLIPVMRADAVATDIPYGRASSTMGRDVAEIVESALSSMEALLGEGSRMVLMHPEGLEVEPGSDWELEEHHTLYVHKLLTRAITVLRRR